MIDHDHDALFPPDVYESLYEIFVVYLIAGVIVLALAAPALWAGAVISALRRSPPPAEIPCPAPGSQVAPASSPSCLNQ